MNFKYKVSLFTINTSFGYGDNTTSTSVRLSEVINQRFEEIN